MRKIAHIINPVVVEKTSDLFFAQPVTFETMKAARDHAKKHVDVALLTAQYQEDRQIVPEGFILTPDLGRSILDFGKFSVKRKLPLIKDILDRMYESSDAEYFVYTNVDIAVLPDFYIQVNNLIENGYDAFVINRRTIPSKFNNISEIPLMYSEEGTPHKGYDCFVFRKDVYPRYKLGAACVGIGWVGRVLLCNLACHAEKYNEFKDLHLTFHIGNERIWKSKEYSDFTAHNKNEFLKIFKSLETEFGPFDKDFRSYLFDTGAKRKPFTPTIALPKKLA